MPSKRKTQNNIKRKKWPRPSWGYKACPTRRRNERPIGFPVVIIGGVRRRGGEAIRRTSLSLSPTAMDRCLRRKLEHGKVDIIGASRLRSEVFL
jgi:hypothetical protein